MLDFWHPIYLSRKLGKRPVAVQRMNRELVLFRDGAGAVGVLPDCCPHRGMRLSNGWVEEGKLVCPYHGWCFSPSGDGYSPGSPRLPVQTSAFDVAEHRGVIWIKNRASAGELHPLAFDGYEHFYTAYFPMRAPVEALMENFTEIEHTGTAHWQFGYVSDRMHEVEVETETHDDAVRTTTAGPQMKLWFMTEWTMGMRTGDCLKFDWTTRFSPLHTNADFWWEDRSNTPRPCRFKEVAFFVPVAAEECLLVSFYFWSWGSSPRRWMRRFLRPFVVQAVKYEIGLDKWLIENVIPKSVHSSERRLGRFDRGLNEQRKRWQRCLDAETCPVGSAVGNADSP